MNKDKVIVALLLFLIITSSAVMGGIYLIIFTLYVLPDWILNGMMSVENLDGLMSIKLALITKIPIKFIVILVISIVGLEEGTTYLWRRIFPKPKKEEK